MVKRDSRPQRPAPFCRALAILALAAGCTLFRAPGGLQDLDEKYGFRDFRFGTPQAQIADLAFIETRNGLACFERRREDLEVGDAALGRIRYCFYDGRLTSVALWGVGAENGHALRRLLHDAYGPGEPVAAPGVAGAPPLGEIWRGARVTAVYLYVEREGAPAGEEGEVVVTLSSNELIAQRDATAAAAAPRGR